MKIKKILILGGGFAGVKTALELADVKSYSVKLITNNQNFEYHPLLYMTATGGRRAISSLPLQEIFLNKPIDLIYQEVTKLDALNKEVTTSAGKKYKYDYLILALGSVTNYFGIKGLKEFSFGIKSLREAEEFKAHLHQLLIDENKPDKNYVIIGGGPTGVELAGALPHYIKEVVRGHSLPHKTINIELIEAAPRILPRMSKKVSRLTAKRLRNLGVKVLVNRKVQAETAEELVVNDKPITTQTVVWTAGVANNPFYKENHIMAGKNGKIQVDDYLQALPGVYVLGDSADTPYSGMAQTALHDAKFVAKNLKRLLRDQTQLNYKPKKPIYVTPTGPNWATVVWGRIIFSGWRGWIMRRGADWLGYLDVHHWWKATELFLSEGDTEDTCVLCASEARVNKT